MKNIKSKNIYCYLSSKVIALLSVLLLSATHKLETSVRTYPELHKFSKINIRGFAKVIVEFSPRYHVAIKSNKKLEKSLQVASEDGELFIKTDVSNFQKHEVNSFSVNEKPHDKFDVLQHNQQGNISFVKTEKQNFLIQDGAIYATDSADIQDLVVIHIQAPEIKNIVLNGGVHLVLKEGNNANKETGSVKGDISLEIGGQSVINIDNLQFANITCKSYDQGNLILQNTVVSALGIDSHGKSKISLHGIDTQAIHYNMKDFSEIDIVNIKCKDIISNLYGESKLNIKTALIEDSFSLDIHNNAKAILGNIECSNANIASLENAESIVENFKGKTANIAIRNDAKFSVKEFKIEKDLILETLDASKVIIDALEVVNLEVNAAGNSVIKLNSGMAIYKALLNIKDRAALHMLEVPIKEANIIAVGSGEANIKVVDKLVKDIKGSDFNFNLKGEPQIYDKEHSESDVHTVAKKVPSHKVKKKVHKIKAKSKDGKKKTGSSKKKKNKKK